VPTVEGTRLYGRGSGDAKASVAAMLTAAKDVADAGGPARGRLLVILGYGEETKHTTMERAVAAVGEIDAAVVGEPTNLDFAVAQRGLMMVDLLAEGDQRHAGYAAADGEFRNAALVLARDLLKLDGLFADRSHAGTSRRPWPRRFSTSAARPTGPTTRWPTCCGKRSARTWWSPRSGWCRARRRPARRSCPSPGGFGRRRRPSAARPVRIGYSCGTPTR